MGIVTYLHFVWDVRWGGWVVVVKRIEWIDKSEYCENWLTISHLDLGEKGLKLEMISMDTETTVSVGLPQPIV